MSSVRSRWVGASLRQVRTDRWLRPPDPVAQRDFGVRRTGSGELLLLLSRRVGRLFSLKIICCQRHVRNDYARLLRPAGSSSGDRSEQTGLEKVSRLMQFQENK